MKNIKKLFNRILILIIIVIIIFCFTGCSSKNIENNSDDGDVTIVTESSSEYIAERGGELDIALPETIESWNPLIAENEDLVNFLSLIYEKPIVINKEGKFEPCLVETWNTSDDGLTYTFSLRKNIKYHNGDDFNAYDIVNTINLLSEIYGNGVTVKDSSSTESNSNDIIIEASDADSQKTEESSSNDQTALDDTVSVKNKWAQYFNIIDNISIIDEYTIAVNMKKPGREALYFMTFPVLNEGSDYGDINGTGPYYYAEKSDNDYILQINSNWWKNLPYISKIKATPIKSYNDKISDFSNGVINFYSTNNISVSKQKSSGKTELEDYNTNYYDCIVFNLFNEKCKDVNVRRAVSYAIDRRALVSSVLLNHATVAEMPIKPDFFAYNVKYKMYEYDESSAIDLIEKSGYSSSVETAGNPLELSIIVSDEIGYEYRIEVVQVIAEQLSSVGINCSISVLSPTDYITRLVNNDFDLAYCSYYLDDNPDVSFMLKTGSYGNYGNISSPELDAILEKCSNAVSDNEVLESYDEFQQYFIEKVPQLGLFYRTFTVVYDTSIKNICDLGENSLFKSISKWSIDFNNNDKQVNDILQ